MAYKLKVNGGSPKVKIGGLLYDVGKVVVKKDEASAEYPIETPKVETVGGNLPLFYFRYEIGKKYPISLVLTTGYNVAAGLGETQYVNVLVIRYDNIDYVVGSYDWSAEKNSAFGATTFVRIKYINVTDGGRDGGAVSIRFYELSATNGEGSGSLGSGSFLSRRRFDERLWLAFQDGRATYSLEGFRRYDEATNTSDAKVGIVVSRPTYNFATDRFSFPASVDLLSISGTELMDYVIDAGIRLTIDNLTFDDFSEQNYSSVTECDEAALKLLRELGYIE